jgi:copper homeostasis protein
MAPLLEVCVSGVDDCLRAAELGADRIELNSALEVGGLTPSAATIRSSVRLTSVPVIVMIRPRPGDFEYTEREFEAMLADAAFAIDAGAAGVAFGVLLPDRSIESLRCRRFAAAIPGAEVVFHRAFDFASDRGAALEQLIGLGVTRVLTSGRRDSAIEGAAEIAALRKQAAGRVEVLPGGGIRASNAPAVLSLTGCSQLHSSVSRRSSIQPGVEIAGLDGGQLVLDSAELAELKHEMDHISGEGSAR